ncbi:MAG TPA: HAD family hydrolase [Candidatus Micrarchaeota archaeon]|nr:HAD family hydrolase [Candidatus Micrarchaeota archaeon]
MANRKIVLLDIDDTLFPSTEFSTLARKNSVRAMIEAGLPCTFDEGYSALASIVRRKGSNYPGHFDDLCVKFKAKSPSKVVAAGIVAYHNTKASIQPYPEVMLTLLRLREEGFRLYAATNGNSVKQWDKLIRLGLHNIVHGAFISEDVGVEKSREFYIRALKTLGAKPSGAVMVGDHPVYDIREARAAGIMAIRVTSGKHSSKKAAADRNIKSFNEILGILGVRKDGRN